MQTRLWAAWWVAFPRRLIDLSSLPIASVRQGSLPRILV